MTDVFTPAPVLSTRRIVLVSALVVLIGCGWGIWYLYGSPAARAERFLNQARRWRAARDYVRAEHAAQSALELNPRLDDAAWLAAESAALRGEFQRSVEYGNMIPVANSRLKMRALLSAAEIYHRRLYYLDAAEAAYRTAIDIDPQSIEAHTGLANLLGLCGRRRDAIPHVLNLVSLTVPTDLLVLLAREDGVVNDRETLERAHQAFPNDINPRIGLAWIAADSGKVDEAIRLLRISDAGQVTSRPLQLALGQVLVTSERFAELEKWERTIPADWHEFIISYARGRMAERAGDLQGATRCYWEAVQLSPESKAASFRLSRLLAEAGKTEAALRCSEHVRRLQELITVQDRALFSNHSEGVQPIIELTQSFEAAGRIWEAYGWCLMAVQVDPSHSAAQQRLAKLKQEVKGIPLKLMVDSVNPAFSIDLSSYPLPALRQNSTSIRDSDFKATQAPLSFRDDAASVGLRFRYFNGTAGPATRRMFEFTGGGIAVIDFDRDGSSDVIFTQGCPWPPGSPANTYGDVLFRNEIGLAFHDVTAQARIHEEGFGQGVTVGDFNSDGFSDLYVANIGTNVLWKNNGDGTFTNVTSESGLSSTEWTTSCVLADLSGDGLPDIYDVNYVTGKDVFDRVCQHQDGSPKICMPFDFDGQPDRLWLNNGQGGFTDVTGDAFQRRPEGKGLGIAVWDAHGQGRLSLLVANDTTPNFFFEVPSIGLRPLRFVEQGITSGMALNGDGKATACMGIALGDVSEDGQIDVHVTNFAGESNTLFQSVGPGVYEDRSRAAGLYSTTVDLLGFGTQFLDVDLDGHLELFVSNGHIDDWRPQGRAYEMPPLLLRQRGMQLTPANPAEVGPYFTGKWLGRAVVRCDWNRDGREDLIVGHLQSDSALLTNTTQVVGRHLAINLFGVNSNRDAIGTTVRAQIGKRSIVRQLTAGDGYQASNERRLIFGTDNAGQIDELEVRWPSGTIQRFSNVPTSQEIWLVEGRAFWGVPDNAGERVAE